jgi:hypothetical protein
VVSTDLPSDASELSMTEMNAPRELAPAPVPPAPPAPPATARARPPGAVPVAPPLVRVRYELDGAPFAGMISFTSGQASPVTDLTRVRLPWRKEFDAAGGFVPSVSVQGAGPGSISCRIMVDGELVSAVTVEGMSAVATCTAQALVESR